MIFQNESLTGTSLSTNHLKKTYFNKMLETEKKALDKSELTFITGVVESKISLSKISLRLSYTIF